MSTRRRGFRYLFSDKHHGRDPGAAQWLPEMTHDQEFAVFDVADFHLLADESRSKPDLYGIRLRDASGSILELGTRGEQIAKFPFARPNEPWHGYPLGPLVKAGPPNRRGQKAMPPQGVLRKMESEGLIDARDLIKFLKGDPA